MSAFGSAFRSAFGSAFGSAFSQGTEAFRKLLYLPYFDSTGKLITGDWEDARTYNIRPLDYNGVPRVIPGGILPVMGARITLDDEQVIATFTATVSSPNPLNFILNMSGGEQSAVQSGDNYAIGTGALAVATTSGDTVKAAVSSNTALTTFYCQNNQLTGSIPDLSSNTALTTFYCYTNQLTGSIPDLSSNIALTTFYCFNNQLTGSIPDLSSNTALTTFNCYTNQLTGSIPDLSSNTALTTFNCYANQLTGSIPDLSSNTALTTFNCFNNQLTGSIPDLSSNTALTTFNCYTNQLTGYNSGSSIPSNLTTFNASNNALTETAVNNLLIDLDGAGLGSGCTINLSGGTNATPTGAGATAKANLIARGASVTTN